MFWMMLQINLKSSEPLCDKGSWTSLTLYNVECRILHHKAQCMNSPCLVLNRVSLVWNELCAVIWISLVQERWLRGSINNTLPFLSDMWIMLHIRWWRYFCPLISCVLTTNYYTSKKWALSQNDSKSDELENNVKTWYLWNYCKCLKKWGKENCSQSCSNDLRCCLKNK